MTAIKTTIGDVKPIDITPVDPKTAQAARLRALTVKGNMILLAGAVRELEAIEDGREVKLIETVKRCSATLLDEKRCGKVDAKTATLATAIKNEFAKASPDIAVAVAAIGGSK
jgi:hypothetical protein